MMSLYLTLTLLEASVYKDTFIIDADGHIMEAMPNAVPWEQLLPDEYKAMAPKQVPFDTGGGRFFMEGKIWGKPNGGPRNVSNGRPTFDVHNERKGMVDPKVRIQHMDMEGIDTAVVFGTTVMIGSSALVDKGLGAAMAHAYNSWVHSFTQHNPARLKGVAALPLQNIEAAVMELHRAVTELKFVGTGIGPRSPEHNLHDPYFDPLWREAESLNAAVCTHMSNALHRLEGPGVERFTGRFFPHLICHPFEQMTAMACIVAGGVIDRFPKLRVAFLEGGLGWVPFWMDRLDEHYESLGHELTIKAKPSEYIMSGQVFVSFEVDERTLDTIGKYFRDDRILYASDYWHFDGKFPGSVKAIMDRSDLTANFKKKVMGQNASVLFNLPYGKIDGKSNGKRK